uniref:Uncharacterized protein n=1 Tax=Anguilla anguilla TaxID=7936 RepID=A0A0E9WSP7_ANGAN
MYTKDSSDKYHKRFFEHLKASEESTTLPYSNSSQKTKLTVQINVLHGQTYLNFNLKTALHL